MAGKVAEALWRKGRFLDAYLASADARAAPHPFRDAPESLETAAHYHDRGVMCWRLSRYAEADDALTRAYELRVQLRGERSAEALDTAERLAALADYQVKDGLAAERYERVVADLVGLYGDDHVRVAVARRNYASHLRHVDVRAARALLDRALPVLFRLPPEHEDHTAALKADAFTRICEHSYRAGYEEAERAIELMRRTLPRAHPYIAMTEVIAADAEVAWKRFAVARARLDRAIAALRRSYGYHPLTAIAIGRAADLELRAGPGFHERAARLALEADAMYRAFHPHAVGCANTRVAAACALGRCDEAEAVFRLVEAAATRPQLHYFAAWLSNAYTKQAQYTRAISWAEKARDTCDGESRATWETAITALSARAEAPVVPARAAAWLRGRWRTTAPTSE